MKMAQFQLSEVFSINEERPGKGTGIHRRFEIPADVDLNRVINGGVQKIMCSMCEEMAEFRLNSCEHQLCRRCNREMQICPKHKDGAKIDRSKVQQLEYSHMVVSCPYKSNGCMVPLRFDEFLLHIKICYYKAVKCPRCDKEMPCSELQRHLVDGCDWSMHECPFCTISMSYNDLDNHLRRCPRKNDACCVCIRESMCRLNMAIKQSTREQCPRSCVKCFGRGDCLAPFMIIALLILVTILILSVIRK